MTLQALILKIKKRQWWIAVGNTFIITGLFSFSNHPEWGIWVFAMGFIITGIALIR